MYTIRRRRDALDAAVGDVVVRRRLAAELKVWRDGFYAASSSTSSPEPLPHEDAITATTRHQDAVAAQVDDWVGNERDRGRGPELVAEASAARQTVAGSAVLPLAAFLLFSEA